MPHIKINMLPGRDDELKKKVADAVVDTMIKELGCAKEHLSVAIHDVEKDKWNSEIEEKVDKSELYAGEVYRA